MASDCLPQIHLAAVHAAAGYSGDTLGLGIACRRGDILASAGFYRNSIARHSNYAIVGCQSFVVGGIRWGPFAGVASGYLYRNGNYLPVGGLVASIPIPLGELHIAVIPKTVVSPMTAEASIAFQF